MNILHLASQAAQMRGWPCRQEINGELRIEVVTQPGRTQVVNLTPARDGDGEPAVFFWSKAADMGAKNDPWGLLRLNMQLTYGRVALKGSDIIILHALLDRTSDLTEVGKAIFWVGKAADDMEQQTYGVYTDVL
jgi:hypothetical protein